jgi:sulfotransferase
MRKFNIVAGLPRAGSTLLCQILNSNPKHHVTPTSGVIDMLRNMRSTFSHNPSFKAQDRLKLYNDFKAGLKGFLDGYFGTKEVVFDKSRGWPNNLSILDAILNNKETKIIWCYRDPVEIIGSIEAQYQKTILMENADESSIPGAFMTLDRRIGTFANEDGIVGHPIAALRDAIEMGYLNRILFVKYFDLTNNTQFVMDAIHQFLGEEPFKYDLKNIKQSTYENDGTYNYKFLHTIKEGEIKWKKADITLPNKYVQAINEKFAPLNSLIFEGNIADFAGEEFVSQTLNMVLIPGQTPINPSRENNTSDIPENPFQV